MLETISNIMTTISLSTDSWLDHPAVWEPAHKKTSPTVSAIVKKNSTHVAALRTFTLAEVSEHWSSDDCWVIVDDRVYDITAFLDDHPGGQFIIMEYAGRDATIAFRGSRHGADAYDMLAQYLIGVLVENERLYLKENNHATLKAAC